MTNEIHYKFYPHTFPSEFIKGCLLYGLDESVLLEARKIAG